MPLTEPPPLHRVLRLARPMMRGEDIVTLQARLYQTGLTSQVPELRAAVDSLRTVDGLFGPSTERAVCAFQTVKGLILTRSGGHGTVKGWPEKSVPVDREETAGAPWSGR
jgi:peptidoglycan hydrolase-like protein with peptidoglycan-binding domain